jgi:acyl CoA:acetate/3-ketoacid CoA transferase
MYSHIIGVYDELWDIIKNASSFQVDSEGVVVDIKVGIDAHKKIYRQLNVQVRADNELKQLDNNSELY